MYFLFQYILKIANVAEISALWQVSYGAPGMNDFDFCSGEFHTSKNPLNKSVRTEITLSSHLCSVSSTYQGSMYRKEPSKLASQE